MRLEGIADVRVSHASIDAVGRLMAADPAILALNDQAGGAIGAPLAVPQLATVARLSQRLGVLVARGVTVADCDTDLALWVRTQPDGAGVRMAVSGWREVRTRVPSGVEPATLRAPADLAWDTDAALRLTFVSIDAARRLGLDALSLLGQPLTALFTLEAHADGALPILDAVARGRPLAEQRARLHGSDRPVRLAAAVRTDDRGGFAGLKGVARLAQAPAPAPTPPMSTSFTQGLDKALRAPLARIIAHADTIHAEAEGPVHRDYLGYASDIANAGRHLLGLVDDLVDLQAIERDDFTLAPEMIDLADVARRAAGLLAVRAGNAGVAIARPSPDLAVPASGDFRRALQILVNLIGNAVRYSPGGAVITVTAARLGSFAEVVIADQGRGIETADQDRIFDKFERVDPSEAGGNGLGLYIARRLARTMGGDITVESAPGDGARFALTLPA